MTGLAQPRRLAPLVILLALTIRPAAQVVPTAAAPPGPRTGIIVGQVVDATSGAPIAEAIVLLSLPKYYDNPAAPGGRVMADGEGRFFFADLPAGDYYLQTTKEGYARGEYGQRRAWGQSQLLSLSAGERLTDVTLRVWKYGAIAGTVVDEAGEPAVGIAVRALKKNVIAGRAQYGNHEVIEELVPAAITDDRGMFRLSQLMPGTYVVVVPSTHTTLPASSLETQNFALRTQLFWAGVSEVATLGQPRAQQIGSVALMSPNRVAIPPPPSAEGRMAVYRTTYFPAAATAAAATQIALTAGEERTDITIALRPEPAARVSGRLVTPDGSPPPPTTVRLLGASMAGIVSSYSPNGPDYVGFETVTGMSDAAGRFTLLGVPAGEYVLQHAARYLGREAQDGRAAYWIFERITVGRQDLDITVTLRPALRVEGRMEYRGENGAPAPPRLPGLTFETPYGEPGRFAMEARDGTFSTVAPGGAYIVCPYENSGLFVQSVTVGGKDITDRVFNLQSDTTSIVVTYTDRPSKVSGTVTDAQGALSTTAVVLAFPVDRTLWSGYGPSPRNLKSALTARTGVYTFAHLPPGDYYVTAVPAIEADGWQDPARLDALASEATKVTVVAKESKTIDLRLKAPR